MNKQAVVDELLDFVVKHWKGYNLSYDIASWFVKDYADYYGVEIDLVEARKKWRKQHGLTNS